MTNDEVEQMVEQAKHGDKTAFSILVRTYQQTVFRYCYSMLSDRQDAEDIAQDTFIKAFKSLNQYKNEDKWIGWLMTIAHRLCINKLNRNKRLVNLFNKVVVELRTPVTLHNQDDNTYIFALLGCLKPKARSIVILKVIHGYSYEEISLILHESPTNLRKQYERAKQRLKKIDNRFIKERESESTYDYIQKFRASDR